VAFPYLGLSPLVLSMVSCLFSNFNANNFVFLSPSSQIDGNPHRRQPSVQKTMQPPNKRCQLRNYTCHILIPDAPVLSLYHSHASSFVAFAFCICPCLFIKHICYFIRSTNVPFLSSPLLLLLLQLRTFAFSPKCRLFSNKFLWHPFLVTDVYNN